MLDWKIKNFRTIFTCLKVHKSYRWGCWGGDNCTSNRLWNWHWRGAGEGNKRIRLRIVLIENEYFILFYSIFKDWFRNTSLAATGRKLYQDACKLYGVIPVRVSKYYFIHYWRNFIGQPYLSYVFLPLHGTRTLRHISPSTWPRFDPGNGSGVDCEHENSQT